MTESEFIAIAKRPPNEFERRMNGIDQPTVQQMQRELEADAWPWPMSQDARRLVEQVNAANRGCDRVIGDDQPRALDLFNRAEHERFMRGLG